MILSNFEDKYKGETFIIVGCGYGLNDFSTEEIKVLENEYYSIGTNQSYLKLKSQFYISGHFHHLVMQHKFGGGGLYVFQGEPSDFFNKEEFDDVVTLTDVNIVGPSGWLPKPSTESNCPLVGAEQIAFSSTHLAYIFGAKRIVYIGFDFSAQGHFYNKNENMLKKIRDNAEYLKDKYYGINAFIDEDIDDFFRLNFEKDVNVNVFRNAEQVKESFKQYINTLLDNNIEVCTLKEGVLNEMGAKLISIEDLA